MLLLLNNATRCNRAPAGGEDIRNMSQSCDNDDGYEYNTNGGTALTSTGDENDTSKDDQPKKVK